LVLHIDNTFHILWLFLWDYCNAFTSYQVIVSQEISDKNQENLFEKFSFENFILEVVAVMRAKWHDEAFLLFFLPFLLCCFGKVQAVRDSRCIGQGSCHGGGVFRTGYCRQVTRVSWNTWRPFASRRGQRD
jgi:hypothetical protein